MTNIGTIECYQWFRETHTILENIEIEDCILPLFALFDKIDSAGNFSSFSF